VGTYCEHILLLMDPNQENQLIYFKNLDEKCLYI